MRSRQIMAEERGAVGAAYASRTLPGEVTIAIEVGPISKEYGTEFRSDPIIAYSDQRGIYTKSLADTFIKQSRSIGQNPQAAVLNNFGSDASISKAYGQAARCGLVSIPTLNTHGYEIIHKDGINACAELLAAFFQNPD